MVDHFQHIVYEKPDDDPGGSATQSWKELLGVYIARG